MSMKEEYTAIDMSTAAADGFRDGQRAANDHSAQSIGMVGALVTALDGLLSITQDSAGVAGYHLNGNVAEWDEFPEVDTARGVLSLYRERSDKPCFFGIDLAQGALDAGPWRDAIIDQGWTPPGQQQASDKVPCKTHPDAPHGFCRNSSHSEGRYVCECEHWEEPQASAAQSAAVPDAIPMRPFQTVDRGSTNYAAGWNACRKAMLAAPAQPAAQDDDLLLELEGLRESLETARHNWRAFEDRCGDLQVENGKLRDRIAAAQDQGEVQSRERWTVVCGHWQDTTLAIHGERTGHIASGIDEDAAHAIVNAHNQGLPPIAAASAGQEV